MKVYHGKVPLSKEQLLERADGLFDEHPENLKHLVERICQQVLEAEITEHLGAEAHQRTPERRGHRNGYKPRTLNTRVGTLRLSVPQARDGSFSTMLFENYQRSEIAVCSALMENVIQGVSTRKVQKITRLFCGTTFSASTVSNLVKSLDGELEAFRSRPPSGRRYLIERYDYPGQRFYCSEITQQQSALYACFGVSPPNML